MSDAFDAFKTVFVGCLSLEEARSFNRSLLALVESENPFSQIDNFAAFAVELCRGEKQKKALLEAVRQVLPAHFQDEWAAKVQKAESRPSSRIGSRPTTPGGGDGTDPSSFECFYLGCLPLPRAVTSDSDDDRAIVKQVASSIVTGDSPAQAVKLDVKSDSLQTRDAYTSEPMLHMSLDGVEWYGTVHQRVPGGSDSVFFIVYREPIYEMIMGYCFDLGKHHNDEEIKDSLETAIKKHLAEESSKATFVSSPRAVYRHGSSTAAAVFASSDRRELDRNQIAQVRGLGAGHFGTVYLARYQEKDLVAVKMLRTECRDFEQDQFVAEAEVMFELQHPHIVKILGVCMKEAPWLIVLEYMKYGSLKDLLQSCFRKRVQWKLGEQLSCCHQLASALEFMHSRGFVHMDVACRNVLVTDNLFLKLADFGTTQRLNNEGEFLLRTIMRLSVRWMAPETLSDGKKIFSEATDVWSYAVACWEIFTYGRMPFKSLKTEVARDLIMKGKARLTSRPPQNCPSNMWGLLRQCWDYDASLRPNFATIAAQTSTFLGNCKNDPPVRDIGGMVIGGSS